MTRRATLKPRKVGPDSERPPPQNAVAWAVQERDYFEDQSQSPNGNKQSASPSTSPNSSFTSPGPSLVSTPLNSSAESTTDPASLSPSQSHLDDDDSDIEE